MVPAEPIAHRRTGEDLAEQVVLVGSKLIAVVTLLVCLHQSKRPDGQIELALADAKRIAYGIRITLEMLMQALHRHGAVDGRPASLAGDVMEPHHHHALPFVGELVEDHRHLGEQRGVQPAQIDGVVQRVPTLQVLQRGHPPIAFEDQESPAVPAFDEDRIDVQPAVLLDAGNQVPNVLLRAPENESVRAPLHIRIEDVRRRDRAVLRIVHDPVVVRVQEEARKRYGLPPAAQLLSGFVAHDSPPMGSIGGAGRLPPLAVRSLFRSRILQASAEQPCRIVESDRSRPPPSRRSRRGSAARGRKPPSSPRAPRRTGCGRDRAPARAIGAKPGI